ncbi:exopolysaccharide biosynthesis polyprenyl glycosylphosphotransferase [Hyunsoonleella sp. SJ7]|uniref:Exopolysaccharide biosynthesis polyprenyl glycosylphosphotransferase n=1 Tax=Hyunsoonleella aquatilis TaxID=2762758 RepID=A0A923KGJ6_9FLAO|nr:exopolysaccharide biosynthesis polyprenyl glycosylphosphotransferase [Hyunsoonleella aquatilis]MBC3758481.1 exopolysaccharide biosynthesis polyprenyl glycosylphosphotransferase [Hyunsoonleella aquatilis]
MEYARGRYSWLLKPLLLIYDLFVLNLMAAYMLGLNEEDLYFFSFEPLNNKYLLYAFYSITFWSLAAYFLKFYRVYRYTSPFNIVSLLLKQFGAYAIITFAFVGIFRSVELDAFVTFNYLIYSFLAIAFVKFLSYYTLKGFRAYLKGNLRNVLIIGDCDNAKELRQLFTEKEELGYNLKGFFTNSKEAENVSGTINESYKFLERNHEIDEIYCAIDELNDKQVKKFMQYAEKNKCNIKFIPSTDKILTKRLKTDYYSYLPVLSLPEVSLNDDLNKFVKRSFDVVFSLLVIIFIMSWLSIILFILIKLESKGPLFYRHKRNGINYQEFNCYKYRSLRTTQELRGTYVTQGDQRITKIGKFLRKTSIDEMPQFINVLRGEMSVVGPRPHMLSYTDEYAKIIDKYNFMYRHNVKPGITGLAQVSGFRGEIESDSDIINRVKMDIFYIENWSLLLDLKIIFQTIINIFKGEKKAY